MKRLRGVLIIAVLILVLMVVKRSCESRWPGDAGEAARALALRTAFIKPGDLLSLGGEIHLLMLEGAGPDSLTASFPSELVTLEGLAGEASGEKFSAEGKKWVLVAPHQATAVQGWVILQEAGVREVYILGPYPPGGEVLKYQFRPDTTVRPEPEASAAGDEAPLDGR